MYSTFFRTFYLVFAGMFFMLFFAAGAIVLVAAGHGDYPSTIVGVGVAALCVDLILRATDYMRD